MKKFYAKRSDESHIVTIQWSPGNICNYQCSYCHPEFRRGDKPWPTKDHMIQFIDSIVDRYKDKNYTIQIDWLGGEFSLCHYSVELFQYTQNNGILNTIHSNGSSSLNWWESILPYLNGITLNFHPEFANIKYFQKVVEKIVQTHNLNIVWNATPVLFDEVLQHHYNFKQLFPNQTFRFQWLYKDHAKKRNMYDYSDDQIKIIKEINNENSEFSSKWIRKIDSVEEEFTYSDLMDGQNNFKDWFCWAGIDNLSIHVDGEVRSSWCGQGHIGNIHDGISKLENDPLVCTQSRCVNWNDLSIPKEKH